MITKNCTPKQQLIDEHDNDEATLIERGIKLLNHLVQRANRRESVGVGYAQFVCCVHGVESFQEVFDRRYAQSDTAYVLRLAHRITAATGRKLVAKNGVKLEAGMDTFIWQSKPPHEMPSKAFESMPYTEKDWNTAFPDGTRCLLNRTKHFEIL